MVGGDTQSRPLMPPSCDAWLTWDLGQPPEGPSFYLYGYSGGLTNVAATNERRLMPRLEPDEQESAPEASRLLMEQAAEGAGKMLNFYKTFAVSPTAFGGYMDLNATLKGGTLDRKMQESIAAAVSDFNGCDY